MFLLNLTLLATVFLRCATAQMPALEDPGQDLASYVSVSEQIPVPVDPPTPVPSDELSDYSTAPGPPTTSAQRHTL